MNRVEVEAAIVEETGLKKKDVSTVLDSLFKTVSDSLVAGENVTFVRFGSLRVTQLEEREGKSPVNGEKIRIASSKRISFKPSALLKEQLKS